MRIIRAFGAFFRGYFKGSADVRRERRVAAGGSAHTDSAITVATRGLLRLLILIGVTLVPPAVVLAMTIPRVKSADSFNIIAWILAIWCFVALRWAGPMIVDAMERRGIKAENTSSDGQERR